MDPSVIFVQGLGAHRAGQRQLSTEDLELQLENLREIDQTAATLLQRNGMQRPPHPNLVPPAVQAKSNPERAFQFRVPRVDSDGFGWHLELEPALPLVDLMKFQFHGIALDYRRVEPSPKKNAISARADSGESEAWTAFLPLLSAWSARMVPGRASLGSVAPITSRSLRTASARRRRTGTAGPEDMTSTSSSRKGLPSCTA